MEDAYLLYRLFEPQSDDLPSLFKHMGNVVVLEFKHCHVCTGGRGDTKGEGDLEAVVERVAYLCLADTCSRVYITRPFQYDIARFTTADRV